MTTNIDPTPYIISGATLAAITFGLVIAIGKLFERLIERARARAESCRPAQVSPAAPPVPQSPRDGVPTRAATDAQTTAYRTERR